jgi:dihydrofolate reductase
MRKLFAFMVTTLDGYYEGQNQEFDWPNVDDAFLDFSVNQLREVGVLLFGRVTYEGMAAYWPSDDARKNAPEVADLMNSIPKLVFSTTLTEARWQNTTLVTDDVEATVSSLKDKPGGDLAVFGSSRLTVGLIGHGLVDELRVMVNPVLLGVGHSLLSGLAGCVRLELLRATTYRSGNVLLCYHPDQP